MEFWKNGRSPGGSICDVMLLRVCFLHHRLFFIKPWREAVVVPVVLSWRFCCLPVAGISLFGSGLMCLGYCALCRVCSMHRAQYSVSTDES